RMGKSQRHPMGSLGRPERGWVPRSLRDVFDRSEDRATKETLGNRSSNQTKRLTISCRLKIRAEWLGSEPRPSHKSWRVSNKCAKLSPFTGTIREEINGISKQVRRSRRAGSA